MKHSRIGRFPAIRAPSLRSSAWRLAEIALVVAIAIAVSTVSQRSSSERQDRTRAAAAPAVARDAADDPVADVLQSVLPAVVYLAESDAVPLPWLQGGPAADIPTLGSAFAIDDLGDVVTNHHVVVGVNTVRAVLVDKTTVTGRVIGRDPATDLAVVRLQSASWQPRPLPLGDSDSLRVGQQVIAVGSPAGLSHTVTTGIVSAVDRTLWTPAGRALSGVIQTDAATFFGNSGGPLLNSRGEVVGVMTSTAGSSYGFAIPINTVKRVVPELVALGYVRRPWLGITGVSLSPAVVRMLENAGGRGVLVGGVIRGGPADQAGLLGPEQLRPSSPGPVSGEEPGSFAVGGDVIRAVDGKPVRTLDELASYLESARRPGDRVTLDVLRKGVPVSLGVVLGEKPAPAESSARVEPSSGDYGATLRDLSW